MTEALALEVQTPLGFTVRCSERWWLQIATVKHPVMSGRQAEVAATLQDPDEIRQSTKDPDVLLFYRGQHPRWLCAVTKRPDHEGYLITAYPTDAIKAGTPLWTRSR